MIVTYNYDLFHVAPAFENSLLTAGSKIVQHEVMIYQLSQSRIRIRKRSMFMPILPGGRDFEQRTINI